MMYLKTLWIGGQKNLSVEEAQKLIAKGKTVCAAISEEQDGRRISFVVEGICEISEAQDLIILRNAAKSYSLRGWDDNVREMHVIEFLDYTDDTIIRDSKEAQVAIKAGHRVRATDWSIKTAPIVRFLSPKLFETASGSRYKMI